MHRQKVVEQSGFIFRCDDTEER